jgi:hypothetical protein
MATLSELQAWRDALFAARLSGVREVRDQNGESIRYASDREVAAALAAADRAIAEAQAGRPPSTIIFRTSKGV